MAQTWSQLKMTDPVPAENNNDPIPDTPPPEPIPVPAGNPFAAKKLVDMNPEELEIQRRSYTGSSSIAAIIGTGGIAAAVISVTHKQPDIPEKIVHLETGMSLGISAVFFIVAAYHFHLLRRTGHMIEIRKSHPVLKPEPPN